MVSDLDAPLGRKKAKARPASSGRRHLPIARLASLGLLVLLGTIGLRIILVDDPEGGRPFAEMAISSSHDSNTVAGANAIAPPAGVIAVGPEVPASELATREGSAAGAADLVTPATTAPGGMGTPQDLVEHTDTGPIPRIASTGETPFAAYSRPVDAASGGRPRVAVVVTGLGLNVAGTLEAVAQLPDQVSLAFAPYGRDLERTVGTARADGHEIFLEVPLEPFDYPENDPGPDTLLTGQAPRDNMRKLYTVMSSFGGYAGVINNMGARFTASGADFGPMMEELGSRGLGYLDDGSSNRSLAPQLAQANRVPFGRVDQTLDANPARAPILEALTALEATARERGSAIGLISALPISLQTLIEWARTLEEKGIELVPASALMGG